MLLVCVVVVGAMATISGLVASLVALWTRVRRRGRLGLFSLVGLVAAEVVVVLEGLIEAVVFPALFRLALLLAATVLRLRVC